MINYYSVADHKLAEIESPREDCWISLVHPTEQEITAMSERYGMDMDAFQDGFLVFGICRPDDDVDSLHKLFFVAGKFHLLSPL